jgi:2-octaprenyl-6-methoxyphenol hydroxylase
MAPLVALCEGRLSTTREKVGIGAQRWAYGQIGIVCTIRHAKPHHGLAVERFFPDGPFARLPMTGDRSSIVWALEESLARPVMALDDAAFLGEVADRFGDDLGGLSLEGPRWGYPLVLVLSERYTATRLALVGDAARGIHPIAGQGWNLALRDVAAVAEIVVDRLRLGLDPGDDLALERYAAWRRFDSMALVAVTDGINRLFANDVFPVRLVREAGLALVDRIPPAKRFFMRHAMGLVGDLPRAMRGEAL